MKLIQQLKKSILLKTSAVYTLTNIINAAIPFLMMPILTRELTPVDYGIVSMFQVLVGIVAPFTGLSVNGAINRKYYDRDKIDFPKYVANSIILLLSSTLIVGILFILFSKGISDISAFPKGWLWAVLVVSFCQFIISIVLVHWQVQVKPLFFGIFQISNTLLNVGLSLWFVLGLNFNWQGRIQGQVVTAILFAIVGFIILNKNGWIKWGLNKEYMKNGLQFGLPLIPHTLGAFIITMSDRLFLTNMVGVAETGLYTVGYQFGNIIGLVQDAFNKAWVPWLFGKLKVGEEETKKQIVKITYIYFVVILTGALLLSVLAPWFLSFFVGEEFRDASKYVFWVALGYAFNGMYKLVGNYIFYAEKTKYLAWITFLTAILNIIFTYVMIKINGPIGAAQATALAFFISFILTWILSSRIYKMPWFSFNNK
ncbi:lipopolysaccharide biosynthesis protein [Metabacillus halosaccharovorans]|uniref:lipopolysaccharide biosynthesis protein n=1 Tax=Metabacillus halosaccharovorans TaxID=930124 RepID=UPI003736AB96